MNARGLLKLMEEKPTTAKELIPKIVSWYSKKGINISDYHLEIMSDKEWEIQFPGKDAVGQTSQETMISQIRESYYTKQKDSDRNGFIVHEMGHLYAYKNGITRANDYPLIDNLVENHAFGFQIVYLKEKGLSKEIILQRLAEDYPADRWEEYSYQFKEYVDYLKKNNYQIKSFNNFTINSKEVN